MNAKGFIEKYGDSVLLFGLSKKPAEQLDSESKENK